MGLSREATNTAFEILTEINGGFGGYEVDYHDPDKLGIIMTNDMRSDGSVERAVLNVREITPEQVEIFEKRKEEVPNSSIYRTLEDQPDVTCIGWF
ncbi:MAG: hypothetical protein ABJF65_00225 [Reichenbachiella sp.]|uniref:hypothetical protein n=1 Tax=Reichenbachiella sp. TaxID=2184521 RepID=UPI00326525E8